MIMSYVPNVENLTPEALELGRSLLRENAKTLVITDETLQETKANYPLMWKDKDAKAKLCFIGCPHLSLDQLRAWSAKLLDGLDAAGLKKVRVPVVLTAAVPVLKAFRRPGLEAQLKSRGIHLSYICPLMYMNNPMAGKMPVITNSNKLRTYTSTRYYQDADLLALLTGGKDA